MMIVVAFCRFRNNKIDEHNRRERERERERSGKVVKDTTFN
jgi:hypothetical protein